MHIYSPADATIPIPRYLLPHLNPDWFHLSGTGLPTLSWKRGCSMGVVVVVMFISNSYTHTTVVSSGTSCLNLFQPIRILASTAASASPCLFQIHTHTTVKRPFVPDYQKKHSPTHTHPDYRTSIIIFFHLQQSMASSLLSLRA